MTAQEALDFIKAEMNYNPQFGNVQIIPLINREIKALAIKTDFAKSTQTLPIVAQQFNYLVSDNRNFRIINVWYGQQDARTSGDITLGHKKLIQCERETLNQAVSGFWLNKITNVNIPFTYEINLTFEPTPGYYLVVEYTSWVEIPQTAFDNNEDLNLYIPESIHEAITEKVIARLKLRDRDVKTAGVHFEMAADAQEDIADVHQEKVTHLDDEV